MSTEIAQAVFEDLRARGVHVGTVTVGTYVKPSSPEAVAALQNQLP
ncbi:MULTISPECIES: hypothetical protein [Microvirga]|nr:MULTISPECIES: hypothetical protein [unclassified Microvirga]